MNPALTAIVFFRPPLCRSLHRIIPRKRTKTNKNEGRISQWRLLKVVCYLKQIFSRLCLEFKSEFISNSNCRCGPSLVLDQKPDSTIQSVLSWQILDWNRLPISTSKIKIVKLGIIH